MGQKAAVSLTCAEALLLQQLNTRDSSMLIGSSSPSATCSTGRKLSFELQAREERLAQHLMAYSTIHISKRKRHTYLELLRRREPQVVHERVSERRRQLPLLLSIRMCALDQPHPRQAPIKVTQPPLYPCLRPSGLRIPLERVII